MSDEDRDNGLPWINTGFLEHHEHEVYEGPVEVEYNILHQVFIRMPGDMDRVEAVRKAIAYMREYMITLPDPEGSRLVQACPERHEDLGGGTLRDRRDRSYWIVKCVSVRKSRVPDMGWEDLLDHDDIATVNRGAIATFRR